MGKHEIAATAPMPSEPGVCRWCSGRLTALTDDGRKDHCSTGCAKNDQPIFTGDCDTCGREFHTGKRWETTCYECDRDEHRRGVEVHRAIGNGYHFSRYGRGRHRS